MKQITLIVACLFASLVAGCGTTPTKQPEPRAIDEALREVTGQNGRTCVYIRDIRGYGTLSDSVLSVSARQRKQYLMVTLYRCPSMQDNAGAAFWGAYTEFCGGGRDSVQAGARPCPVRSVFEFESRDDAFAAHDQALELIYGPEEESESEE